MVVVALLFVLFFFFKDDDDPDSEKDGGDFWQTGQKSQKDAWIGWNFGVDTKVQIKEFLVDNNYTPRVFHDIALEGSNDGSEWIAIMNTGKINWTAHNQAKTFQVGDNWKQKPAYNMVRIFNSEFDPTGSHALIGKLKFVGSASTCTASTSSTVTTTSAGTTTTATTTAIRTTATTFPKSGTSAIRKRYRDAIVMTGNGAALVHSAEATSYMYTEHKSLARLE